MKKEKPKPQVIEHKGNKRMESNFSAHDKGRIGFGKTEKEALERLSLIVTEPLNWSE